MLSPFKTRLGLALVGLLALAACATPTPYQPMQGPRGAGYSDERLSQNRFRVTFRGNSVTPRIVVENYLLRRASEVTLAAGYTHFVFDTRDTKANTTYYSDFVGWPGWHGYGWYWHSWNYGWPEEDVTTRAITDYEAYAEIVLLTPEQAKSETRAVNAREVLDHLASVPPAPPVRSN